MGSNASAVKYFKKFKVGIRFDYEEVTVSFSRSTALERCRHSVDSVCWGMKGVKNGKKGIKLLLQKDWYLFKGKILNETCRLPY